MSEPKKQSFKERMKVRLKDHLAEYGKLALIILFSLSALTYTGFYIAIRYGVDLGDSTAGSSGTFFAAWVANKVTMPFRIGATLLLTPIVAAILHKLRGRPGSHKDATSRSDASGDEAADESA